jgi:aryl-alcohol dehydrogenase-like predicted oxidoreductase
MAIPKCMLGKTGVEVTALGLGGVCWNLVDEDRQAVEIVHYAIDRGITYLEIRPAVTKKANGAWD